MSTNISYTSIDISAAELEKNVIAFQEIPLTALSKKSLQHLSILLNSASNSPSEDGYDRDWRGLASLAKQRHVVYENIAGSNPTAKVIELWCTNNPHTATFARLQQFLGLIGRWDVADVIHEYLVEDTKAYQKNFQLSQHFNCIQNVDESSFNISGSFDYSSAQNLLTASDVIHAQQGLPFQMYDGFLLYADADLNNVADVLTNIEDNPQYNINFCMKYRDLLRGVQFDHAKLTQLIDERCKALIVILTDEFLESPEYEFLINYTQALQLQQKSRNILTLQYEENVEVPTFLKKYTHIRYLTAAESLIDFYSNLVASLESVSGTSRASSHNRNIITRSPTLRKRKNALLKTPADAVPIPSIRDPAISGNTKKERKWIIDILDKVFCRSNS